MNEDIKNETEKLVRKIRENFKIKKIILFGSYAYGKPGNDSDIDLCVISDENKRKLNLMREIRSALSFSKYPLDILVYKQEEFDYRADSSTSMENQIKRHGVVLYEQH